MEDLGRNVAAELVSFVVCTIRKWSEMKHNKVDNKTHKSYKIVKKNS